MAAINKYTRQPDPMMEFQIDQMKHKAHLETLSTLAGLMNPYTSADFNAKVETVLSNMIGINQATDETTQRESSN
jgi:hypothetical protein